MDDEKLDSELKPEEAPASPEAPEPVTAPAAEAANQGEEYAPYGSAYTQSEPEKHEKPAMSQGKKTALMVTAAILVIAIILGCATSFPKIFKGGRLGNSLEIKPVKYPVVLVHGLGGFGEDAQLSSLAHYWGGTTGSLVSFLQNKGYEVYAPSVGPYSSTWDRTCELYAILTGTRVDYGEAHSKAHGHERYGREYTQPLIDGWGKKLKINLVGHSFGGETVRMLAYLLENGDETEKKTSGKDTSPLFTGGKGNYVFSVTTLSSPHNGSQLTEIVDSIGGIAGINNATDLMVKLCFAFLGTADINGAEEDLMLSQFGIGDSVPFENAADAIKKITAAGNDHAFYDLSPDGAAKLNKKVGTVDGVYYFSYSWSTVTTSPLTGKLTPRAKTFPAMFLTAAAISSYSGKTKGGIEIDSSWHDNDGLVSVVSAQYPAGQNHAELTEDFSALQKGLWYVAPTQTGDHGTPVGLGADAVSTHNFYLNLLKMLESLKR